MVCYDPDVLVVPHDYILERSRNASNFGMGMFSIMGLPKWAFAHGTGEGRVAAVTYRSILLNA